MSRIARKLAEQITGHALHFERPLSSLLVVGSLLAASAAGQGVTSPTQNQRFCHGQNLPVSWQQPASVQTFNPLSIRLKRQADSSTELLILVSPSPTATSHVWPIPSTVSAATDYYIVIPYQDLGTVPFQSGSLQSQTFEIGCSGGGAPGASLAQELAQLEELLFHEYVQSRGGRAPTPSPTCTSCPYKVDSRKLASILRRAPAMSLNLRIIDRRGAVVADLGRFQTGAKSQTGSSITTTTTRRLTTGRTCSFALEVLNTGGKRLSRSSVCLRTTR